MGNIPLLLQKTGNPKKITRPLYSMEMCNSLVIIYARIEWIYPALINIMPEQLYPIAILDTFPTNNFLAGNQDI